MKKKRTSHFFLAKKRLYFIVHIKAGMPVYLKVKNEEDRGNQALAGNP
jgi:hypothetical protein